MNYWTLTSRISCKASPHIIMEAVIHCHIQLNISFGIRQMPPHITTFHHISLLPATTYHVCHHTSLYLRQHTTHYAYAITHHFTFLYTSLINYHHTSLISCHHTSLYLPPQITSIMHAATNHRDCHPEADCNAVSRSRRIAFPNTQSISSTAFFLFSLSISLSLSIPGALSLSRWCMWENEENCKVRWRRRRCLFQCWVVIQFFD